MYCTNTLRDSVTINAKAIDSKTEIKMTVHNKSLENGKKLELREGDNNINAVCKIQNKQANYLVNVVKKPYITGLKAGNSNLTPEFNREKFEYSATTANNEDIITVENPKNYGCTIDVNGDVLTNNKAKWKEGNNKLTLNVTKDNLTTTYKVKVTYRPPIKPLLSNLKIGENKLDPTFNKDIKEYKCQTKNKGDLISATPAFSNLKLTIKVNGEQIENNKAATWKDGVNTVEVRVILSMTYSAYKVEVTKKAKKFKKR